MPLTCSWQPPCWLRGLGGTPQAPALPWKDPHPSSLSPTLSALSQTYFPVQTSPSLVPLPGIPGGQWGQAGGSPGLPAPHPSLFPLQLPTFRSQVRERTGPTLWLRGWSLGLRGGTSSRDSGPFSSSGGGGGTHLPAAFRFIFQVLLPALLASGGSCQVTGDFPHTRARARAEDQAARPGPGGGGGRAKGRHQARQVWTREVPGCLAGALGRAQPAPMQQPLRALLSAQHLGPRENEPGLFWRGTLLP